MYLVKIIDNGDQIVISIIIFIFYILEEYEFNMEDISILKLNKLHFVKLAVILALVSNIMLLW